MKRKRLETTQEMKDFDHLVKIFDAGLIVKHQSRQAAKVHEIRPANADFTGKQLLGSSNINKTSVLLGFDGHNASVVEAWRGSKGYSSLG